MVVKKCSTCLKNVTRKLPGLECSRCSKIVHATPECAKLSNKQLITLRASNSLEWSCENCLKNISNRSSFFTPEEESEDEDNGDENPKLVSVDIKKLLHDISQEIKKSIREQLEDFQRALTFATDEVADMGVKLESQETKIKKLENRNMELCNQNKNLELRVAALEQHIQNTEQKNLCNALEIAGIPKLPEENLKSIATSIANKLDIKVTDIESLRRLPGRNEKPGQIFVELKSPEMRDQWVAAAKSKEIFVKDLKLPTCTASTAAERIYIREALTSNMKTVLYNAKHKLRGTYKYVWLKRGRIYAKKADGDKAHIIRSVADIESLLK
ncbi:unnamed protein product [Colias eurytheme]|nr:unnamed protein product [Colias eurytheme]